MKLFNKELIIAILIGFFIGLIITYGIWTANQAIKQKQASISPVPTESLTPNKTPAPSQPSQPPLEFKLSLGQPQPYMLSNTETGIITGTSIPFANIIVYGEKNQKIILADKNGQFKTEIPLLKGINYLTITAISDKGEQLTQRRTVVYSSIEIL